jgi:hypothetical protein
MEIHLLGHFWYNKQILQAMRPCTLGSIPNADHCAEIKKETKKLDVWHETKVEEKSSQLLLYIVVVF